MLLFCMSFTFGLRSPSLHRFSNFLVRLTSTDSTSVPVHLINLSENTEEKKTKKNATLLEYIQISTNKTIIAAVGDQPEKLGKFYILHFNKSGT